MLAQMATRLAHIALHVFGGHGFSMGVFVGPFWLHGIDSRLTAAIEAAPESSWLACEANALTETNTDTERLSQKQGHDMHSLHKPNIYFQKCFVPSFQSPLNDLAAYQAFNHPLEPL